MLRAILNYAVNWFKSIKENLFDFKDDSVSVIKSAKQEHDKVIVIRLSSSIYV